jgi:signal transduction histidine kinase
MTLYRPCTASVDKLVCDGGAIRLPQSIEPEYETVALSALIDDVLRTLPPADGVQIAVSVNNLDITVDPHPIRRVSANLIPNAMQAMSNGRTLTVTATAADGFVAST